MQVLSGQVGIIPTDCIDSRYIISNKQLRVRVNQDIVFPLYLFYWFTSERSQKEIDQEKRGVSIPLINLGILRNLHISFPSIKDQQEIASILSLVDKKINCELQKRSALEKLFQILMINLMTGRVRINEENTMILRRLIVPS